MEIKDYLRDPVVRKKLLKACLYGFALITVVYVLLGFIKQQLNGTLVIKTNDSSSEIEVKTMGDKTVVRHSNGGLRTLLPAGYYVVTVNNRLSTTKRDVYVKNRQTNDYSINLKGLIDPEPVLPFGVYGAVTNGSQMIYANLNDHHLYQLSDSAPVLLDPNIKFGDVKWKDISYGVGISDDGKQLFEIINGGVALLPLPFTDKKINYDLAGNGTLVITDGRSVYIRQPAGSFSKIYESRDDKIGSIGAGDNILLRLAPKSGDSDETKLVVINQSGKQVSTSEAIPVYSSTWAPDGNNLAITNSSGTAVYDSRLNKLADLPDPNVLGLRWLNDNELVYGVGEAVFSYNIKTGDSAQLTSLINGGGVSGIFSSQDNAQVYVLSQTVGDNSGDQAYSVFRIRLNEKPPDYAFQLGVSLPKSLTECYVSYVNFTRPIVIMSPYSDALVGTCSDSTRSALTDDQLDLSQFTFYMAPVVTEGVD